MLAVAAHHNASERLEPHELSEVCTAAERWWRDSAPAMIQAFDLEDVWQVSYSFREARRELARLRELLGAGETGLPALTGLLTNCQLVITTIGRHPRARYFLGKHGTMLDVERDRLFTVDEP